MHCHFSTINLNLLTRSIVVPSLQSSADATPVRSRPLWTALRSIFKGYTPDDLPCWSPIRSESSRVPLISPLWQRSCNNVKTNKWLRTTAHWQLCLTKCSVCFPAHYQSGRRPWPSLWRPCSPRFLVSAGSTPSAFLPELFYCLQRTKSTLIADIDGGTNVARGCVAVRKCSPANTYIILPYTAGSTQHPARVTARKGTRPTNVTDNRASNGLVSNAKISYYFLIWTMWRHITLWEVRF